MTLAGVGDNVVDRYRDLGTMFPGGQALNVAVYAHRAGIPAAYVGALGDDVAGRRVLGAIHAEGLDDSHVRVVPGPNAYAEVAVVEGNREFLTGSAGVSKFQLSLDDLEFLSTFDLIHSSESSYLEDQLGSVAAVGPLSFDFSVRCDPAYVDPLLPYVSIAEFSLADLDDSQAEAWLERVFRLGPRMVLATRGAADALLFDGTRLWRQPSAPTDLVDTLGAGDAFIGRFLAGVVRGEPHESSLAAAAVTAASTCRAYGAFGYGMADLPRASWTADAHVAPRQQAGQA
jgi:fructoselysine 6-kinase